jgi:hypothetical protein
MYVAVTTKRPKGIENVILYIYFRPITVTDDKATYALTSAI